MSMARREPKWKSRSLSWAGQAVLVQRHTASPSARGGRRRRRPGSGSGIGKGAALGRALVGDDLDQVGDDVARALDQHGVADAHVLAPDLVLVVQAHVADRDAGQLHRLELRRRG